MRVTWAIQPVSSGSLEVGDRLLPMLEFPRQTGIIRVRRVGEYEPCGLICGDGARYLMDRFVTPYPEMIVKFVSPISGWGKARMSMYELHRPVGPNEKS